MAQNTLHYLFLICVSDETESASSSIPESNDQANNSDVPSTPQSKRSKLPRIFDGIYYEEILERSNGQIWAKCTVSTCRKVVKGNKTSTGNFKSHYRTQHSELIQDMERYLDKKQKWEPIVKPTHTQTQVFAPAVRKEEVIFDWQCIASK